MKEIKIGIFLDRVNGTANAIILNPENHKYVYISKEIVTIKEDSYNGIFDAVNEVCNIIQVFSEREKLENKKS